MYYLSILTAFNNKLGLPAQVNALFKSAEQAIHYAKPFIDNGHTITLEKIKESNESEAE